MNDRKGSFRDVDYSQKAAFRWSAMLRQAVTQCSSMLIDDIGNLARHRIVLQAIK
jgi:hypothetical protein